MKIPKRKLFLLIIFAYVAFSLYAAYNVFFSTKVISRVHRVVKKESAAHPGSYIAAITSEDKLPDMFIN